MKPDQERFLKLLFNEGETICVTSGAYGAHSISQDEIGPEIHLRTPEKGDKPEKNFTISEDDIELVAVNPINGWKRDSNVTAYRNFMIELDDGSLESQTKYIKESGIPYSASVYSGNKSMHFVIAVTQSYNETIWRFINQWILNVLKMADQQNKSPSRGVRFPENVRKSGAKKLQTLVEFNGRITQSQLNNWLSKHMDKKPKIESPPVENYGNIISIGELPPFIIALLERLKNGEQPNRNLSWFKIASFCSKRNMPMSNAQMIMEQYFVEEDDFRHGELMTCLKSAYKGKGI